MVRQHKEGTQSLSLQVSEGLVKKSHLEQTLANEWNFAKQRKAAMTF